MLKNVKHERTVFLLKESNMRTPIVFYSGLVVLFCAMLSLSMMGGLYARYALNDDDGDNAKVAKISYIINGENSEYQLSNVDILGNSGAVLAVELSFSIENDGEVDYDYTIDFTLTNAYGNSVEGYTLGAVAENVFMLSSSSKENLTNYAKNNFYYRKNGDTSWSVSPSPSLSDRLSIGQTHTYTVLYFINMTVDKAGLPLDVSLDESINLNYNVVCAQID